MTVDKTYRRKSIEDYNVDLPYINLSFFDNLPFIKSCAVIFLIGILIIPFLPPRHSISGWTFPTSLKAYSDQMMNVLYLIAIIISLVLFSDIISNIRTFIDRRMGYKKVGIFTVRLILSLLTRKIIILNNRHFFTLRQNDYGFKEIEIGQVLEIERTATHKFMDYQILT